MGICSSSNLVDFNYIQIVRDFGYTNKYSDPRFGEVHLLKHKRTGAVILQKDYITNTLRSSEKYLRHIQTRSEHPHPNIINILGYTSRRDESLCSTHYRTSVFFESFVTDLEQELHNKIQNQERFNESDLWSILKSVAAAGAFLQSNNEFHGDIRPRNILVTSAGEYKITDDQSFSKDRLSLYFAHLNGLEDEGRLYSPFVFSNLNKYDEDESGRSTNDIFKSEVFSLGMTLLECASLERADQFYDTKTHQIKFNIIQRKIEDLKKYYSASFVRILESVLDQSEKTRLDFSEINDEGESYKDEKRVKQPQSKAVGAHNPSADDNEENQAYQYFGDEELEVKVRKAVEKTQEAISRLSAKRGKKKENPHYKHFLNTHNSQYADYSINQITQPELTAFKGYPGQMQLSPGSRYEDSVNVSSSPVISKYGPYLSSYKPEYTIGPTKTSSAVDYIRNKYGSALSSYRAHESSFQSPQHENGNLFSYAHIGGDQNTTLKSGRERPYQTPERPSYPNKHINLEKNMFVTPKMNYN